MSEQRRCFKHGLPGCPHCGPQDAATYEIESLRAQVAALTDRLAKIEALHQPTSYDFDEGRWIVGRDGRPARTACTWDNKPWPCATVVAARGEDPER